MHVREPLKHRKFRRFTWPEKVKLRLPAAGQNVIIEDYGATVARRKPAPRVGGNDQVARWFRIFEKKRGQRRTGSTLIGRIGEAAFFGAFFLLGAATLTHVVLGEVMHPSATFGLGFWLLILVLASFVLIGGGGVLWAVFHSGTSAERRSALVKRAHSIDLISDAVPMPREYPTLPADNNLTNSPGVLLAYRLPTVESPIWGVLASALFCLAWNGVSSVLTVWATRSWTTGDPEWLLSILLLPAHGVGAWSIYYFLRQLIVHTGMGPTIVEVSNHPLYPGGRYELLISQSGHMRMKFLAARLVCEEEVTYHQGTDIRHEVRVVFERDVFRLADFMIEPASTFEKSVEFSVPVEAMHSFSSAHNSVNWRIVVSGEADEWPSFVRSFPLIVYPLRQQVPTAWQPAKELHVPMLPIPTANMPHEVGA